MVLEVTIGESICVRMDDGIEDSRPVPDQSPNKSRTTSPACHAPPSKPTPTYQHPPWPDTSRTTTKTDQWVCELCGQRFVVPSLARDCETKHLEDDDG